MFSLRAAAVFFLIFSLDASRNDKGKHFRHNLPLSTLIRLYGARVYKAEWMVLGSGSIRLTGVRVTLQDGSQKLIHKEYYGLSSEIVVDDARHMSSLWKSIWSREFKGRMMVMDFIKAGETSYNILFECNVASINMILQ